MNQDILNYIKSQKVGVLAVEMLDGSPHVATLHYAHTEGPLTFFFRTHREYRKTEPLYGREVTRASFVIGFDENNMKTFQMDGTVQLLKTEEIEIFSEVYFNKFAEKGRNIEPDTVLFKFTPTWWRFTDWTTPQGKIILTSTDK